MARARAWHWGRAGRALVVAGLVAQAAACTLLTSLDGLTGGVPGIDGGSNDGPFGPHDTGGGVTPEADSPGTTADASDDVAPPDDASDASAPTGDASPFCALQSPAPLFCDDFDEDVLDAAALAGPWDQVTGLGGTVQRKGGIVTSAPLAMLVTSNANVNAIDLCGYKSFPASKTTGQFTLAFDIYVVAADTTASSDAVLGAIELIDLIGTTWALQLEVSYDSAAGALDVDFSENQTYGFDAGALPTYTSHPATATLPIGAWTRVSMEATIGSVDGAALHFGTKEVAKVTITPKTVSGHPEILVGGTYAQKSTQGWTVRYDDVTFDVL